MFVGKRGPFCGGWLSARWAGAASGSGWAVLLGPGDILSVDGGFGAWDVENFGLETITVCLCPHV
jgi:hypothetical protein